MSKVKITATSSNESLIKYQTALEAISNSVFDNHQEDSASLKAYKEKMRLKMVAKQVGKAAPSESLQDV